MDKIEDRLHDSSKSCFECYEAWASDKKDAEARAKLQEAIHELRKVASRLEIELAVSDRDQTQHSLPVPTHRDGGRRAQHQGGNGSQDTKKKSSGGSGGRKRGPRKPAGDANGNS